MKCPLYRGSLNAVFSARCSQGDVVKGKFCCKLPPGHIAKHAGCMGLICLLHLHSKSVLQYNLLCREVVLILKLKMSSLFAARVTALQKFFVKITLQVNFNLTRK